MIDNARECAGLYLLKVHNNPEKQAQVASSVIAPVFPNNDSEFMLCTIV